MAIPIAVAGAEQSLGVFQAVAQFAYSGAPFNINIKDNGSFDPDAGSIVAWAWTLVYKPPGSAASLLNPTTATPTLQNVDVVGTYKMFLEVTDDNAPPESSESSINLAPNSAFCKVVHKTQYHDWRIPASTERTWADVVYAIWTDIDTLLPTTSLWDVSHQLFFTAGNTAQIKDNRVATTKGGQQGLWLNSTTGVNAAAGAYYGLQLTPGRQLGAGDPTTGVYVESMDLGVEVIDAWYGDSFLSIWETDPAVLTNTNVGLKVEQRHASHDGGNMLEYNHTLATKLGTNLTVKHGKAIVQTWGSSGVLWSSANLPYYFGAPRLFLTELTFDHRLSAPTYLYPGAFGDEDGTIKWFIDAEDASLPQVQDIVLMRVVRQEPIANNNGKDFGLVWRESVAELAVPPADPDIYPSQTFLMRRPDTEEFSVMGVQRARVAAPSTPVPFEKPGWIQGQLSNPNPPGDDITEWTFFVTLPSTVTVDLSEGGGWSNARAERPVTTWSAYESDFVVSTYLTGPPGRIQVKIKYAQPYATASGQGTFTQAGPTNATPYLKVFTLPTPLKVGPSWAQTMSIHLTPFMDGTIVPPAGDLPLMAVDQVSVDGSNNLTAFTYIVQPREDDHPVPTSLKFFWSVQVEKRFYTSDKFTEFHWSAMVTITE